MCIGVASRIERGSFLSLLISLLVVAVMAQPARAQDCGGGGGGGGGPAIALFALAPLTADSCNPPPPPPPPPPTVYLETDVANSQNLYSGSALPQEITNATSFVGATEYSLANATSGPSGVAVTASANVVSPGTYTNIFGNQEYIGPVGSAADGSVDYEYTVPAPTDPGESLTDPVPVTVTITEQQSSPVSNFSFQSGSYTDVSLSGDVDLNLENFSGTYSQTFDLLPETDIGVSIEANTSVDVSTLAGGALAGYAQASVNLTAPPPTSSCGPFNVNVTTGAPSTNDLPTAIFATYTPSDGKSLLSEAAACGYQNFDWQQQILILPEPSPYTTNSGIEVTDLSLPTFDPVYSGYTYPMACSTSGAINDAYPYYYDPTGPSGDCFSLASHEFSNPDNPSDTNIDTLNFGDNPSDVCLPGDQSAAALILNSLDCTYNSPPNTPLAYDAPGSYLLFETSLVGIEPNGSPSAPLYTFDWTDDFNGTSGGVATTANDIPTDPGSGTGGITILSLNGVPVDNQPEPVDEPNSLFVLGGGLILLLLIIRSRKRPDSATSPVI